MKKILFSICLVLGLMFTLTGCANNSSSNKDNPIITKIDDLTKTKEIIIKSLTSKNTIKTIDNKDDIDKIINIIMSGEKIGSDETVVYIGATYTLKMYDEKKNLIEKIDLYLPSTEKRISLNTLNESYYVDVDKILEIANINI